MIALTATRLTAHAVAAPLLRLVDRDPPQEALVLGSSSTGAYLLAGVFVIAITGRGVPLMPNGVRVIQTQGLDVFRAGARARVSKDEIRSGGVVVGLVGAEVRQVDVPRNESYHRADVARRGSDLFGALGLEGSADLSEAVARARPELAAAGGLRGARALVGALQRGDFGLAAEASLALVGRGPGLTPDGDDLLAAAAAATIAFEHPVSLSSETAGPLRAALLPADLDRRTGALSATLLRLAVEAQVIDPVRTMLDLSTSHQTWVRALTRLLRIGHGTGRTYALGCALAALSLSHYMPAIDRPEHEERNWT